MCKFGINLRVVFRSPQIYDDKKPKQKKNPLVFYNSSSERRKRSGSKFKPENLVDQLSK